MLESHTLLTDRKAAISERGKVWKESMLGVVQESDKLHLQGKLSKRPLWLLEMA